MQGPTGAQFEIRGDSPYFSIVHVIGGDSSTAHEVKRCMRGLTGVEFGNRFLTIAEFQSNHTHQRKGRNEIILLMLTPEHADALQLEEIIDSVRRSAPKASVIAAIPPQSMDTFTPLVVGADWSIEISHLKQQLVPTVCAARAGFLMLFRIMIGAVRHYDRERAPSGKDVNEGAGDNSHRNRVLDIHGAHAALSKLTPREKDVARLMAEGLANKQIADQLSISESTAEKHLNHIFQKWHVSCRTEGSLLYFGHTKG